jgi:glycosyltransferase involved in cell wall biosynthesis
MGAQNPFISVAMMVKNEEEFLEEALTSARAWADEIIVVDTGSTDRTVEIAKSHGAKLSYFEWCDDFSAARNETLRCATGNWIIILDADERLRGPDPAALRKYLKTRSTDYPFEVVNLKVINTTLAGKVRDELMGVRIIPNDRRLGYANRVHNLFGSLDPNYPDINIHTFDGLEIVHLGYDPQVYEARKKGERSLPLIEMMVKENPSDPLYQYYLGREYYSLKRYEEAVEVLKEANKLIAANKTINKDLRFDCAWFLLKSMMAAKMPVQESLTFARDTLRLLPIKADLWYLTGHLLVESEQKAEAIKCFERTLALLDTEDGAEKIGISHIETKRAEIYQLIGELAADGGDLNRAYGAFVQGLEYVAPENTSLRLSLINCSLGLAIDVGDITNLPVLMELLLQSSDESLDLFFVGLEAISKASDRDTAVDFLKQAQAAYPHLLEHPKSSEWSTQAGV